MKFQPGQVVHVVRQGYVLSRRIFDVFTYADGTSAYRLESHDEQFKDGQLFATFDNAMAELKRQNEEGK